MKNNELLSGTVSKVQKSHYTVLYQEKNIPAKVSGRFSYIATEESDYPVVGDKVSFRYADQYSAIIERVESRGSYISRVSKSNTKHEEVLAANINIAFICVSLNKDFNVRKIERFISLVSHPDIEPILLLTKKDLVDDINPYLDKIKYLDIKKIVISSFDNSDVMNIKKIINGNTVVCIGASGVGKSTLVNQLVGFEYLETDGIRESDAQGHHTTTHRELIKLDTGGAIIDTPGIRLITRFLMENLVNRFESINEISKNCRFTDCKHVHEPGCAVLEAIEKGTITLSDYEKYKRTERYNHFLENRKKSKKRKNK